MRRSSTLAAITLTSAALVGAAALPAQAAQTPAPRPAVEAPAPEGVSAPAVEAAEAGDKKVSVKVAMDQLGAGNRIADALKGIKTGDRGHFVREAVNRAFSAAGGRHNVMLMNLSQGYKERLRGKRLYANVQWGNIYYGLWIAESGEFTNEGDGGWINWGFKGWFDRNGGHVKFRRP
ncbi:stress protein [Streptomyces sp. MUM 203J]|uniref:SPOR domain-containing protein n=1 Tax=Streptomyces sp. MUM 203J TaxID=2791990 RepID=UPI001F039579|nr:stress protein [Streptomyces sp. MUM 203J]MCH0542555.1 stress protein [Streptomyces sp. MUM 203J]